MKNVLNGRPKNWIVVDILRVVDGIPVERRLDSDTLSAATRIRLRKTVGPR